LFQFFIRETKLTDYQEPVRQEQTNAMAIISLFTAIIATLAIVGLAAGSRFIIPFLEVNF
jgi:hypothetical protein